MKKRKKITASVTLAAIFSTSLFIGYDINYAGESPISEGIYYEVDATWHDEMLLNPNYTNWKNGYYMMSNDEGNLAIFNTKGEQVTEYEYKSSLTKTDLYKFIYGTAICLNKQREYGIINTSGELVCEYGIYKEIQREGALYKATDKNGECVVLNSIGIEVYRLAKNEEIYGINDVLCIVENKEKGVIKLFNNEGRNIDIIDYINSEYDRNVAVYLDHIYTFIYGEKTYLIDTFVGEVIGEFEGVYRINSAINNNGNDYLLLSNGTRAIFLANGEVVLDVEGLESCNFTNNMLVVKRNGLMSAYDISGNEIITDVKSVYIYKDNIYAIQLATGSKIEVYNNGSLVMEVGGYELEKSEAYTSNNVLILKSQSDNKKYIFDFNGNILSNTGYNVADLINNKNCNAIIVSERDNSYKLMNIYGRIISNEYFYIEKLMDTEYGAYFIGRNSVGEMTLINDEGKVIFKGDGMKVIQNYDGDICITMLSSTGTYNVYNLENEDYIIKDAESVVNCDSGYITVTYRGKRKYYTYTGVELGL